MMVTLDAGRGQAAEEVEAVKRGGGVWHYRPLVAGITWLSASAKATT